MSTSQIRVNFHEDSEAAINKQINLELFASYSYMAMAAHFDRDDVALTGFAKKFRKESEDEREHAMKLIDYQNKRGGRVVFEVVQKPVQNFETALEAVEASLEMEKTLHNHLNDLHKVAEKHDDAHLADFIEGQFLGDQVETEKKLGDLITQMKTAGNGVGLYIIDKELQ